MFLRCTALVHLGRFTCRSREGREVQDQEAGRLSVWFLDGAFSLYTHRAEVKHLFYKGTNVIHEGVTLMT